MIDWGNKLGVNCGKGQGVEEIGMNSDVKFCV